MTTREERQLRRMRPKPERQCVICLRPQGEVRVLIDAGTNLYLCDGCIADLALAVEEAARGDVPARFVRVVGVVVRGDSAIVAQLMNDRPPYEVETAHCHREGSGWRGGLSGNSTGGYIPTSKTRGTVVVWGEAPGPTATAARFEYRKQHQVVPVTGGCALAVFDDVPVEDGYLGVTRLAAWLHEDGTEQELPEHEPPLWLQEKLKRLIRRP